MKKQLLMAVIAAAVLGSSMTVCAAPQYMADGNVFDAEWYLEQNPDVKANWSLGTSTDAVYKHYTMHGASEGRKPYDAATFDSTKIQPNTSQSTTPAQSENTTPVATSNTGTLPFSYTPPAPGTVLFKDDTLAKENGVYSYRLLPDLWSGYRIYVTNQTLADTVVVYDSATNLYYPILSTKTPAPNGESFHINHSLGDGSGDLNSALALATKQSDITTNAAVLFNSIDTSYFFLYKDGVQAFVCSAKEALNYVGRWGY